MIRAHDIGRRAPASAIRHGDERASSGVSSSSVKAIARVMATAGSASSSAAKPALARFGLAILLAPMSACASVVLTPKAMHEASVPPLQREELVQSWNSAVEHCNAFLASPFRRTLPAGHIVLDEERGMRFETARGTWPLEVRCTSWGDVVTDFGYAAQEGTGGFTVGSNPPARDRLVDNSLFRTDRGELIDSNFVAELILHEATHLVYCEGAIGFWKSWSYYLETVFLFRYGPTHSDERRPYSTSEEYELFIRAEGRDEAARAQLLNSLDDHISAGATDHCDHGPPRDPCPAPLPRESSTM
jgi:hypothetical protein